MGSTFHMSFILPVLTMDIKQILKTEHLTTEHVKDGRQNCRLSGETHGVQWKYCFNN